MIDLPCIIEAMKTLDYNFFFKSQDAAQMLYVHSKKITEFTERSADEIKKIIEEFNPVKDDPRFMNNIYSRKKVYEQDKQHDEDQKKDTTPEEDISQKPDDKMSVDHD